MNLFVRYLNRNIYLVHIFATCDLMFAIILRNERQWMERKKNWKIKMKAHLKCRACIHQHSTGMKVRKSFIFCLSRIKNVAACWFSFFGAIPNVHTWYIRQQKGRRKTRITLLSTWKSVFMKLAQICVPDENHGKSSSVLFIKNTLIIFSI